MKDLGPAKNVLGISIKRDEETGQIRLSQERYIKETIERFGMQEAKSVSTPIESNTKITTEICPQTPKEIYEMKHKPYRKLIGALIHLANATRPDIAFAAATLSRFCVNPGKMHWIFAKRVLCYLKATSKYCITYIRNNEKLKANSDSDGAGDVDDRKSCTGNLLVLSGGPISWKSVKQSSVALSTMEAEYAALAEVLREVIYVKRLLNHIDFKEQISDPIDVYCDNQSAIELSKNAVP
ncbi:uncharacterized protein LOC128896207 [Hylaeus anthracinus]|uniref:uncharacterized protein LOC128896207 n=1 Tax=Hylaeus anthracinus TaxID=313031 RepID=UPI0023B90648|nr:uncharacterized protein LOC128896207 [Hylaeus anthracinus]